MQNFSEFKKQAISNQPVFYDTGLGNVQVEDLDVLKVDGTPLKLTNEARSDLHDILKIPNSFADHVENKLGRDARLSIADSLRSAISEKDGMEVKISLDRASESIIGISENFQTIKVEGFFDLFNRLQDRYNLEVSRVARKRGVVNINAKSPRQFEIAGKKFPDEVFNTGISFRITNGVVNASPYVLRLICTNGMTARYEENHKLSSSHKDVVASFFEKMDELSKQSFAPSKIRDHVLRAISTRASVDEAMKIRSEINDFNVSDSTANSFLESLIPMMEIRNVYDKHGHPIDEMSITQRKSCMTNLRYWDVVNGLTDFASHDYTSEGFNVSDEDRMELQELAGRFLQRRTLDCENRIPTPPEFAGTVLD